MGLDKDKIILELRQELEKTEIELSNLKRDLGIMESSTTSSDSQLPDIYEVQKSEEGKHSTIEPKVELNKESNGSIVGPLLFACAFLVGVLINA